MEFVISHKTKVAQMSPDMKITQVKSNGKSLKNIELPDVMTAIRSGEQAKIGRASCRERVLTSV